MARATVASIVAGEIPSADGELAQLASDGREASRRMIDKR
jgi:hypothetical protein